MDIRRLASLIATNVVPAVRSVRAESFSTSIVTGSFSLGSFDVSFDPTSIDIQAVAGGYGTILEFSPGFCLQTAAADLGLAPLDIDLGSDSLKAFIASSSSQFTPALNIFCSNIDWSVIPYIELAFAPTSLQFPTNKSVEVLFTVTAQLFASHAVLSLTGQKGTVSAPPTPFPLGNIILTISAAFGVVAHASILGAEITCPVNPPSHRRRRIGVGTTISVEAAPGQDIAVFLNGGLRGLNGTTISESIQNVFANTAEFHLVPPLSLLGQEPYNSQGVSVPNFQVDVVALAGEAFPVLAVGFNLKTGCSGSLDHIQQFIGSFDFGSIIDEFTVETMFKHKWALPGKFERTLPLSAPLTVTVNNQAMDVTLEGTLQLNTLDVVSIEPDANTRTDVLSLQGTSTVTAKDVVTQDGTHIGPDQVDFGPPQDFPWSFRSTLKINVPFDSRPGLRAFETKAYNDAFNFIARPFPDLADPSPVSPYYVRVDAVAHRIYTISIIGNDFPF